MDRYALRFGSAITQDAFDRAYQKHRHLGHDAAVRRALVEALRARDRLTAIVQRPAASAS